MAYHIKEAYLTLQGEGAQTGRAAIFMRFTGCNLWSGRHDDRASAICRFCDTDFVGTDGVKGGTFKTALEVTNHIKTLWPKQKKQTKAIPYIICTGGEPLLQLDDDLLKAFHAEGFEIGVETNGTLKASKLIDWLCVSPKGASTLIQKSGDEIKLVYPQNEAEAQPENFIDLDFRHFFLQPMEALNDPSKTKENIQKCIHYCRQNPQWRLSLQTHKMIGID